MNTTPSVKKTQDIARNSQREYINTHGIGCYSADPTINGVYVTHAVWEIYEAVIAEYPQVTCYVECFVPSYTSGGSISATLINFILPDEEFVNVEVICRLNRYEIYGWDMDNKKLSKCLSVQTAMRVIRKHLTPVTPEKLLEISFPKFNTETREYREVPRRKCNNKFNSIDKDTIMHALLDTTRPHAPEIEELLELFNKHTEVRDANKYGAFVYIRRDGDKYKYHVHKVTEGGSNGGMFYFGSYMPRPQEGIKFVVVDDLGEVHPDLASKLGSLSIMPCNELIWDVGTKVSDYRYFVFLDWGNTNE